MRLDRFLSESGFYSRKQAQELCKHGKVSVNSKIINDSSFSVSENDAVFVDNNKVDYSKFIYIMLNKPSGCVTASFDKTEKTVFDYLPPTFKNKNIMPVGRLDKDTVGLLLLTNDGVLSHKLTSPKHSIEKEYSFVLADEISDNDIQIIQNGVVLKDGEQTRPCKINMKNSKEGNIIITEGKYHEIKRLFGYVSNKIIYLKREREGGVLLDANLKEGEYRLMTKEEIANLIN